MKNKIILFVVCLSLVLSLLVIPSFAVEAPRDNYYQIGVVDPNYIGDFELLEPFFLFKSSTGDAYKDRYVYGLKRISGVYSYYYRANDSNYYWDAFNIDDYVIAYNTTHLETTRVFIEDEDTDFYANHPKTISPDIPFDFSYNGDYGYSYSLSMSGIAYVDPDGSTPNPIPFDSVSLSRAFVALLDGYDIVKTVYSTTDVLFRFNNYTFGFDDTYDYFTFYMAFHADSLPDPDVPGGDGDGDVPSIDDFDFVIDFVVSVFDGLDNLVIYPGVSVLDLLYGIIAVYFCRFMLKLIAGG